MHRWSRVARSTREVLATNARKFGPLEKAIKRRRDAQARRGPDVIWSADSVGAMRDYFDAVISSGQLERPTITLSRRLHTLGDRRRARALLQAMQNYPDLRPTADICLALSAITEPMPDTAWTLFDRNDLAMITRTVPRDYFRFAFARRPDQARAALQRALSGDIPLRTDAEGWFEIGFDAFAAGCDDVALAAMERAEDIALSRPSTPGLKAVLARIETAREWISRIERAERMPAIPPGEVSFALVGFSHPNPAASSSNLADFMQTAIVLGHLLRHDGLYFGGRAALSDAAPEIAEQLRKDQRIAHAEPRIVQLHVVERDASRFAEVPAGTWTIVSEWFVRPLAARHLDIPLNPRLRPVFVGFHITVGQLSTPGAVEYLREHAPIGCIDWDTVYLLHAAGVPAFFSGGLCATSDVLFEPAGQRGRVSPDAESDGPGGQRSQQDSGLRGRPLAANLGRAVAAMREFRDDASRIVTQDLNTYLAVRGLGVAAKLRSPDPERARVVDNVGLSDTALAELAHATTAKLAAVFGAIIDGRSEAEIYQVWRDVCAADVAEVQRRLVPTGDGPRLSFDLDKVCASIVDRSVTIERTDSSGQGPEINVEFSLDANYKHQLDVVLDSVVTRTGRPVRAFVLCRGHNDADFARMARLFPSVSFVWLPTDAVDYGRISDLNKWVTPATMDRTILPVLLPHIDRIIHFDLDALCLADLGELFDVDMEGSAIASTREPQPKFVSGFETYRWSANRLRREGLADRARDLTIRTHAKDRFDFDVFNAGIMVMDLAKMRADDFCGTFLPYVQHYGLNGQIVLNTYTGNTTKYVDPRWNQLVRIEVMDEPKIAHWAGPMKPWKSDLYVAGRELWDAGERSFAERVRRADGR